MNNRREKTAQNREELLAKGSLGKLMFSMGIPSFIAQLIYLLYNIVDRVYIGHIPGIGASALTGVGICFPIISLIMAFSNLAGAGGAPLAGIALGKGEREKAEKIVGNSLFLLIIFSFILTIIFQIIKKQFLYMFGASDNTYPYAGTYLTIYLMGTVFVMISMGLNTYITVQGQSTIAMLSVVIGAVINLILDPIFIFVFDMGVQGAAYATIISQAISSVWILKFLTSKKATLRIYARNMKPDGQIIKMITSLGISPFIMAATESLITVVFNSGAQKYGDDLYVGSITIVQSISQMIFTPLNGFTQGVSPIISFNYGAGNLKRVKKTCGMMLCVTGSFAMILGVLFILFPQKAAGIFTNDAQLLEICEKVIPVFLAGVTIFGLQCGSQTSFMALGKAKQSLFFALLRKVILLTPLALILPAVTHNVMGLYYAEPISDAVSAITCFTALLFTLKQLKTNP